MKRSNPWALPQVKERRFERTFTDPEQEEPLTLTFRRPDPLALATYLEQSMEWARDYAEGVPTPDGDVVVLPESQWNLIGTLMACEVSAEGNDPYTNVDWIGVAKRYPSAWFQIIGWLPEVTQLELPRDAAGNSASLLAPP